MPRIKEGHGDAELYKVTGMDRHLPGKDRRKQKERSDSRELERAIAALRESEGFKRARMDLHHDPELGMVVMTVEEHGKKRVLREVSVEEVLRLARSLRAGRAQLMDLKL
jgi:uncharacterized FlaG/YvyC family protein